MGTQVGLHHIPRWSQARLNKKPGKSVEMEKDGRAVAPATSASSTPTRMVSD